MYPNTLFSFPIKNLQPSTMNIKISLSFIIAFIFLFAGCTGNKTKDIEREIMDVRFNVSDNRTADTLVSSINYIGLTPINDFLPGNVDKLCVCDSNIIIADYKYGRIFIYDLNGKSKALINHLGLGPGEYVELRCMAVDSSYVYVVDNSRKQLLTYRIQDGHFVKSAKMPLIADDIETLKNGGFVFASILERGAKPSLNQEKARLFITDKDLNITNTYYRYEGNDYESIGQKYYLTKNEDTIVFSSVMFDGLTLINAENLSIQKQVIFTFENGLRGKTNIPVEEISSYEHFVLPPYIFGDYMFMTYANGNRGIDYGIWDTMSCELLKNPVSNISHAIMPIVGVNSKQLYGYVENLEQYSVPVEYGFTRASEEVENILKDGGAALVVYQMK